MQLGISCAYIRNAGGIEWAQQHMMLHGVGVGAELV